MKSSRFIETVISQNVCLFCLSRLHRSTPTTLVARQKRRISRTHAPHEPPAEAVAPREDDNETRNLGPQQQPKRWGQFGSQAKLNSAESLPDPDSPQTPKWGRFGVNLDVALKGAESFPDPDLPPQTSNTDSGFTQGFRAPKPNPRWDEPASGAVNGFGRPHASAHERERVMSDGVRIKWHSVGREVQGGQGLSGGADSRFSERSRTRGDAQGWGTHLKPRRSQLDRSDISQENKVPVINHTGVDNSNRAEQKPASRASGSRYNFQQRNRDQTGFVSFKPGLSNPALPPREPTSEYRGRLPELPFAKTKHIDLVRVPQQSSMPLEPTQTSQQVPAPKESAQTSQRVSMPIEPAQTHQQIAMPLDQVSTGAHFATETSNASLDQGMPSTAPAIARESEPELVSLEERREVRARKDKRGKRGNNFEYEDEASFLDAAPKRQPKGDVPKRRQRRFEEEGEDFGFDEELVLDEEADFRKKKQQKKKRQQEKLAKQAAPTIPSIELPPFISVEQLATALHVRLDPFIEKMEELGFEEIANDHVLNFENSSLIAMEYGYEAKIDTAELEDLKARPAAEDASLLPPRPPIVTIMGHVDHGKTTLLDFLRKSSVAASEHGGITQHIGAFSVPMTSGKVVTFLDTPGHAAFLSMRQRGANVTDIVVLVVAADDSVKPQTLEAIKHARSAKVPIIVAINKVDKDEADIQRVKQDLLRHEIEVEDFGGDVQAIPVSGKTGQGMEELEEALVALAETIDMRAEPDGQVEGWILEATTKKAGRIATVLVRRGTLRPGDIIVAGTTWARVRTLKNEAGVVVPEAPPGTPVEIDGWRDQPTAGDEVLQAPNEQKATSVVDYRIAKLSRDQDAKDMEAVNEARQLQSEKREREKAEKEASANDSGSTASSESNKPGAAADASKADSATPVELYILIKADVSGSAEAIEASLLSLPVHNHPINLSILRSAVGPITESDVAHISSVPASHGFLVSFNQPVPQSIAHQAEMAGVRVFDENIIYKVIDNVRAAVEDHLPPLVTRRVTGEAEAAQVFEINVGGRKFAKVLGCKVRNGVIAKGKKVRVYRGGMDDANVVYVGTINSLKSQKKDVSEMRKGTECGMGFEGWEGFLAGDVIQCYDEKSEKRRLV